MHAKIYTKRLLWILVLTSVVFSGETKEPNGLLGDGFASLLLKQLKNNIATQLLEEEVVQDVEIRNQLTKWVSETETTVQGSELVAAQTIEIPISLGSDDAEEKLSSGNMDLYSTDLELILESENQIVGMRFQGINITPGSVITNAYIEFEVDETSSTTTNLTIRSVI